MAGGLSRRALAVTALVCLCLFSIDAWLVLAYHLLPFDVPLEVAVQEAPVGPLAYAMELTNSVAGYWQLAAGVAVVVAFAVYDRRAGWLMALGGLASPLDNLLKVSVGRARPTPDLVDVLSPNVGYSFPSGHAVFYTWLAFMAAAAVVPAVRPRRRWLVWAAAATLALIGCSGRVWAGAHWPSDVLGGILLALGWSCFVLWVPERWLPTPSRSWWRRRSVLRRAGRESEASGRWPPSEGRAR